MKTLKRHVRVVVSVVVPLLAIVWVANWQTQADVPRPGQVQGIVARTVGYFLENVHLSRKKLDDDVSREFFRAYLKDLDPGKMYFTRADIEEFSAHETTLDDEIKEGNVQFGFDVFNRYLARVRERVQLVNELLSKPLDLHRDEYLITDSDQLDYPADDNEIRDRWRKRLKYEVLRELVARDAESYDAAVEEVRKRYRSYLKTVEQTKTNDVLEMYLSALAGVYDPHTSYMSPDTYEDFNISMRLHLEGIGAQLRWEDGYTIVEKVLPGGPASRDGQLKPGDKIIGVAQGDDGEFESVVDRRLIDVVKLIRGPRGTVVRLRVLPSDADKPVVIRLVRDKVDIETQAARGTVIETGKRPDGTPYRVGVIKVPSFYLDIAAANAGRDDARSTTRDVRRIIEGFKASGKPLDALILDLRFNGGGALSEAISMVGLFIKDGPVVQVQDFRGNVRAYKDQDKGDIVYDGPMVVLVNRFSASASEIFAGAMQDYGRALIVGDEHTHGKGTVQTIVDLDQQFLRGAENAKPQFGALKITIQEFYRVNGDSTQNRGVESDLVLPSPYDHMEIGERYLEHALPFRRVQAVEHDSYGFVTPDLIQLLAARSAQRIARSEDFQKLNRRIEILEQRRKQKRIPLHIDRYREEVEAGAPEEDSRELVEKLNGDQEEVFDTTDFYNQEVLHIVRDYLDHLNKRVARLSN